MLKNIKHYYNNLGPGLLFAAQSVGASHLVQSTRAGGEFGLSLAFLVALACFFKYPAFRFGIDYANIKGQSLLEDYFRQGKFVTFLFFCAVLMDMFIATAAVTLVSAGLIGAAFDTSINIQYLACGILLLSATLLIAGRYQLFERITKALVIAFVILILIATVMATMGVEQAAISFFPDVNYDKKTILFIIAVAGWMPTSVSASVYLSEWRAKKNQLLAEQGETQNESIIDFEVGYWGTMLLAFCFLLIGALLIYPTGMTTDTSAIKFSGMLFTAFATALGQWALPIISITAIAVMMSTSLSLIDACPRTANHLLNKFAKKADYYPRFIAIQIVGAGIILLFLMSSFTSLIDLATSLAFLTAPLIAILNHRAVFNQTISIEQQPNRLMKIWSLCGIVMLTLFAFCVIYFVLFDF